MHHQPGGASSICLGGGYGGEGSVLDKKKPAVGVPAPDAKEEEKKEETQQAAAASTGSTSAAAGAVPKQDQNKQKPGVAETFDVFGNKVSGTSVRVHAPPGGKSSITFG